MYVQVAMNNLVGIRVGPPQLRVTHTSRSDLSAIPSQLIFDPPHFFAPLKLTRAHHYTAIQTLLLQFSPPLPSRGLSPSSTVTILDHMQSPQ